MTTGKKIALLKERLGYKDYQRFGEAIGVSGGWLLDQTKKTELTIVNIEMLKKVAVKCNVSLDWLLIDKPDDDIVILDELRENDLLIKLNELQQFVDESKNLYFNNVELSKDTSKLASDGIKVLKQLINSRI